MKRAVKLKLRSRNPVEDVESPRPVSKEVQALDEEQTVALLKVAEGTPLYMPILFAVTTGLRRGELVGLKWKDIDLETSGVTVSRSIQQTKGKVEIKKPKTESSKRTVTIPSIAMEALQTHRIEQNKQRLKLGKIYQNEDWVFAKPDGSLWKPDSLTQAFRKLISDSGLPKVRFHDLRHSHASQLLKKGVHPKVAQERLGHSSIAITLDLYSHLLKGVQEEAASKVDEALRSAIKKPSS
ncbi:MAG: site-specific integrase [Gammaproteobacteria bacterium]|nr:site-specific integrase [Gammaproteobacteria bacterium]MDH5801511.1 site-specific integrase [Gammaproteobacteria bacterium]